MTKATILVVDDHGNVRRMVREYLEANGFRVVTAENGEQALYAARHERPDLVLLDIMMPKMDGFAFMRAFRRESDAPVIMLTARLDESDKVVGLELGADDYVTKPFGMRELLARIRAALRRAGARPSPRRILQVGPVRLDRDAYQVTSAGKEVRLTPSEFILLETLMRAPGRVFTRQELLDRLGDESRSGTPRSIDIHIRNLRTKIEPDPSHPRFIETVFGRGYRFCEDEDVG
ncbi:MAG: DNA-binding response regulator [Anaerolineae bacterium]|nr:MAG: DNA-binding response regulator [Anaerolineae bacterium]